jgi:eukaryotic-like serine/threonine-protein kinase
LRTRRWLALLALAVPVVPALAALPAAAATPTRPVWTQYQGSAQRSGFGLAGAPEPPYTVSWHATAGVGEPSSVLGTPAPILTDDLAIVIGRETVEAIDTSTGQQAWSVPRALGPSAAAAIDGDTLVFVEGGGDGSTASSSPSAASPSPTTTNSPNENSPSASPSASTTTSTLVGMSLRSQRRLWTVPLTDVSRTGVLIVGGTVVVGADDGTVTAVDLDGKERWSQDVGDHVLAPMAATDDLVFASVRPESRGPATLVALHTNDGSQAWRYEPPGTVLDLGGPSVATDTSGDSSVYVVGSDASVRALSAADGSQRWAAPLYSPTDGSPPALTADSVVVTDQSGTVYALDRATGTERWRFATNRSSIAAPMVTAASVIQPAADGTLSAISLTSGHLVWHGAIADSGVLGVAARADLIVASVTGTSPGIVGLINDPAGATEDVASPTTPDPGGLLRNWVAAALPLTVLLVVIGQALATRMGPVSFDAEDDDAIDPWEADLEDEP